MAWSPGHYFRGSSSKWLHSGNHITETNEFPGGISNKNKLWHLKNNRDDKATHRTVAKCKIVKFSVIAAFYRHFRWFFSFLAFARLVSLAAINHEQICNPWNINIVLTLCTFSSQNICTAHEGKTIHIRSQWRGEVKVCVVWKLNINRDGCWLMAR